MLFKKKFQPDLIDLVKYEKDLLYQKKHRIELRPVAPVPHVFGGGWSDSEMQAMRDNREKAQALYDDEVRVYEICSCKKGFSDPLANGFCGVCHKPFHR